MRAFKVSFNHYYKRYFLDADSSLRGNIVVAQGSSEVNDFIPYHALLSGLLLKKDDKAILTYQLVVPGDTTSKTRQYEEFFRNFMDAAMWVRFAKKGAQKVYKVRAGTLVEIKTDGTVIPLMILVVNRSHMLNINKDNPDPSQFFFVVNKEFITDPDHKPLYNAAKRYILDHDMLDVIHTTNILRMCYKYKAIEKRTVKSIAEAKQMNKDLTATVIRNIIYG